MDPPISDFTVFDVKNHLAKLSYNVILTLRNVTLVVQFDDILACLYQRSLGIIFVLVLPLLLEELHAGCPW